MSRDFDERRHKTSPERQARIDAMAHEMMNPTIRDENEYRRAAEHRLGRAGDRHPDAFDLVGFNPAHPLLKLAGQIDWAAFDDASGELYCQDNGAPAKATRLMVGLHYLKHTFNESDAPGNGRGQVGVEPDSGGGRRSAASHTCSTRCRSIQRA